MYNSIKNDGNADSASRSIKRQGISEYRRCERDMLLAGYVSLAWHSALPLAICVVCLCLRFHPYRIGLVVSLVGVVADRMHVAKISLSQTLQTSPSPHYSLPQIKVKFVVILS